MVAASRRSASLLFKNDRLYAPLAAFHQFSKTPIVSCAVVLALHGIDEHRHAAATDQTIIPAVIIVEMEARDLGAAAGSKQRQGALLYLSLHAAPAERATLAAVGENQHRRPRLLRR